MDVCWVWIYGYWVGWGWGGNYWITFFSFEILIFRLILIIIISISFMYEYIYPQLQLLTSLFNFYFSIFMKFNIFLFFILLPPLFVLCRCRKIIQCANIHESDFLDIMSKYEFGIWKKKLWIWGESAYFFLSYFHG